MRRKAMQTSERDARDCIKIEVSFPHALLHQNGKWLQLMDSCDAVKNVKICCHNSSGK